MKPPKRLFKREQPDEQPMPPGQLRAKMYDPDLQAGIKSADIILGCDPKSGQHDGVYYGIAQLKRIVRRGAGEAAKVLRVPVDLDTDDVDVLCAMVQILKGAHCYGA